MLVELAKLDGAFVVRGDGFIETAATFLAPGPAVVKLPPGLGARHVVAASITARTTAMAVAVSSADGNVRVFSNGHLVLRIAPGPAPRQMETQRFCQERRLLFQHLDNWSG